MSNMMLPLMTLDNRHATRRSTSDGALPPVVSRGQRSQQSRRDASTGRREEEQRGFKEQLHSCSSPSGHWLTEQRPLEEDCQTRTPTQTERRSEDVGG